jgi:predicted nuclease of predicted toxin-antitoxin system
VLVKLLLDENISPAVVRALAVDGVDAWHMRDRGLEARPITSCSTARTPRIAFSSP